MGPSGEAEVSSAGQEIPRIVSKPKVHYRGHQTPPLVSILSQITPVQVHPSCCLRSLLNITLPSRPSFSKCSFTFVYPYPIHHTHSIDESFVSVSKEIYCLYWSTNCYSGDQSRIRWAGRVARMGYRGGAYWVLMGRPDGKHSLEDVSVVGRIILK